MPQLVPFYYINEIFFTFVIISTLTFLLSKYILPNKIRLFISRIFIKII
jgi:F-type H+-transporting ATPase subunit 8